MKNIVWDIQYISPPLVLRYCKKCNKRTEYISSGQFRINAQRKYLDIWSIFKCTKCDTTWNATVYSRINSKAINPQLLDCFQKNDEILAKKYAMDNDFLKQNGAKILTPRYKILGENFMMDEKVKLQIRCGYFSSIRVSTILKEKLKLSNSELEKLMKEGRIQSIPEHNIQKARLKKEITLLFNIENP